jgi:hypothetical protein
VEIDMLIRGINGTAVSRQSLAGIIGALNWEAMPNENGGTRCLVKNSDGKWKIGSEENFANLRLSVGLQPLSPSGKAQIKQTAIVLRDQFKNKS